MEIFQTLVYHLIGEAPEKMDFQGRRMFVSQEKFASHLKMLKKMGYTFLTLEEAEKRLKSKTKQREKELLITFDDGYQNTINVAMPILKQEKIPAVMSVCGSYVLEETRKNIEMHVDKNFAGVEDIKKWIKNGNDILAHTYSHLKLSRLELSECEKEINLDLVSLKKNLDIRPNGIVYPYGSVNENVISSVRKYFEYGFSTDMGKITSWNNRYCLKRICVESDCENEKLVEMLKQN